MSANERPPFLKPAMQKAAKTFRKRLARKLVEASSAAIDAIQASRPARPEDDIGDRALGTQATVKFTGLQAMRARLDTIPETTKSALLKALFEQRLKPDKVKR